MSEEDVALLGARCWFDRGGGSHGVVVGVSHGLVVHDLRIPGQGGEGMRGV